MNNNNNNIIVVNQETGEVTGEFPTSHYYIRNKTQDEFVKRKNETHINMVEFNDIAGKFIWSYPAKIQELIQSHEFTKSDLTMIFYLATYINGTDYLCKDNNQRMNKKDIHDVMGVGRNRFNNFYTKLVKHDILIPSGKLYKWNSDYNFYGNTKGKAKPTILIRTYIKRIRRLYEKRNKNNRKTYSPTALYPVFALVPYLHYSNNIICKNPDTKYVEDIEYYNLTEIAELLDLKDSKKMSQSLTSIVLDNKPVFRSVTSKNETYLQLNPLIFWRDSDSPNKAIVSEFVMMSNNHKKRKDKGRN